MTPLPPTLHDIDELLAFLPLLATEGFEPVEQWHGGTRAEDGTISLPWPQYNQTVEAFMRAAAREAWRDYDYQPGQAAAMLQDQDAVKRASLAEIKTMLTYCVRGERFSDGHWADMIEQGHIRRLLERLRELRLSH